MSTRPFYEVDVFTAEPYRGNPLAVVAEADGLSTGEMQRFANWTNFSETTFLLRPTALEADYRVRIFTPVAELPFAGHPTLGTCRVWLDRGGEPKADLVVQECGAGLIQLRRTGRSLAFAAPPLIRSGPVDESTLESVCRQLRILPTEVVDAAWIDNGPGWVGVLLADAAAVLALSPGVVEDEIGVIGPHPPGSEAAFELRAFFPKDGATVEDPVTGSLNASAAQWMLDSGRAAAPYTAFQGTALGRAGRISVTADGGDVWIGGDVVTCVEGHVSF